MSLSYDGKIAVGSTISAAITDPYADEILVTQTSSNTLIRYDIATRSQNGSGTSVLTAPRGLCLVDSASAMVVSSSSTVDLVHLATETKTNYSGGTSGTADYKPNVCAGDHVNKIAFSCTNTSRTLNKFDGNTFTLSTLALELSANDLIKSIIFKGDGRFIIGTDGGQICEIDSDGVIYKSIMLSYLPHDNVGYTTGSKIPFGELHSMTIDNNLLLISTEDGVIQLWDWSTGTKIKTETVGNFAYFYGLTLSESASGMTVASRGGASPSPYYNSAALLDFTISPVNVITPVFYADSTSRCIATGIHSSLAKGWVAYTGSDDIHVFSISPRGSTVRTVTIPDNEDAELLIIQDDGAGESKVLLNTYMSSPGDYRVPTGKTIYEIFKTGSGVEAKWGASKYTT